MRICKRIALIAIISILFLTLNVYAGVAEVTLKASSTEAKVGETVTITLSAKCGAGIEGIDAVLDYDKTKLELTDTNNLAAEDYLSLSDTNDATGKFQVTLMYNNKDKEAPQEATFATLKFKVLDGAKANETLSIKLSNIELGDSADEWMKVDDQAVTIKVLGNGSNPGGNNTTPGGNNTTSGGNNNNTLGDYPYAGIKNYVFIIIFVVVIVAVAVYVKVNKYRGIK